MVLTRVCTTLLPVPAREYFAMCMDDKSLEQLYLAPDGLASACVARARLALRLRLRPPAGPARVSFAPASSGRAHA